MEAQQHQHQSSNDQLVDEMLAHLKPPIPLTDRDSSSKIARFYANRSVFITGATGFIGKALIEKLVRSCPDIKRIYVLIREKKGKTIDERLQDLIQAQNFDRIRQHFGGNQLLADKLRPIHGDITLTKFGISPDDLKLLSRECSIVFNSAATIRFVEPVDVAVRNNICSIGQLIELCDCLENLDCLVHLSTAYSNCHKRDTIHEIFYEPPMRADHIQEAIKQLKLIQGQIHQYPGLSKQSAAAAASSSMSTWDPNNNNTDDDKATLRVERDACELQTFYRDSLGDHQQADQTKPDGKQPDGGAPGRAARPLAASPPVGDAGPAGYNLMDEFTRIALRKSNRPNTYTFTKAISESYLLDRIRQRPDRYGSARPGCVPVAIVRPSIVGGAWREPTVGLVDNYNGPTGAILSLYTGALQAMPGRGERVADLVPVDMVANMVLCTGWYLASEQARATASAIATSTTSSNSSNNNNNSISNQTSNATNKQTTINDDQGVYLFNMVSGYQNPMRWHQVTDLIARLAYKYPTKFLARLPASYFIEAGAKYQLYDLLNQRLPAYLQDLFKSKVLRQQVEGRSSALVAYGRIKQMTDTLTPFTSNQWRLCDDNTRLLYEQLAPIDRRLFPFDVKAINWNDYIRNYILGARIYTLRDEPRNVAKAMGQLRLRQGLQRATWTILVLVFYYLFLNQHVDLTSLALSWFSD